MKLAEALMLRADSQRRLEYLKQRLIRNARVQEGDAPAEDPAELLAEIERIAGELTVLIQRINRTNISTFLADGSSISDALAQRDVLAWRQATYRDLAQAASIGQERYSRSEVKFQSTVNVARIQQQADAIAREYRELDTAIQEMNWLTELED
jgi:hypothetical protein